MMLPPKLGGWKVIIQGRTATFMLWLLVLSTIFLLSSLISSNPFVGLIPTDHQGHNHSAKAIESLNQDHTTNESHGQSSQLFIPPESSQVDGGGEEGVCDYSSGKWIRETRGSIYTNLSCPMLPDTRNCIKYGKDPSYIDWRWKPDRCGLPNSFNAKLFLNIVRGKTLAFVGDSLARNQMDSLLCLLSQVEAPENTYKDDKDRFQIWYFPSHKFTVRVIWSAFLVVGVERVINGTPAGQFNLHLDKSNPEWTKILPKVQYLVLSCGTWFFSMKNYLYKDDNLIGCVHLCEAEDLASLGLEFAIRSGIRTALESISKCDNCEGILTILRTFTSSHFEGGSWFNGGYCNRAQPFNETERSLDGHNREIRKIQLEEMERVRNKEGGGKNRFELLDVTKAMMMRADAHPGSNWSKKWNKNMNDCLHWCLPGPVDMWNDLLLEIIRKDSLI